MAVSSASTASTSASRRAPTRFRRSSRRSIATAAGRHASSAPDTHCSSRRTGSGVAMFCGTQRLLTDCGGAKPDPRQAPKRPHAGPGGRAGVGAGSPSVRCWGGDQHHSDCQGNPFEIEQRPPPRGIWGRRREWFRRSRPLSSGRGLRLDGYFLLNEGWLDGAGGSTVKRTVDQPQQGQTQTTHFSGGTCSGAFDQTGGL